MNPNKPSYKWILLILIMISTTMAILDTTIINSVIPILTSKFDENLLHIEWIITGYLLSMCIMLPTAGWLAEKWGFKRVYLWGMILFTLGSYLCFASSQLWQLIVSRVIEGFGSGIVQSVGLAIITRHFPAKTRTLALGLWGIAAAAAVSMGPYLGGVLLKDYGWNSLFIINVPIGILDILGAWLIMRNIKTNSSLKFSLWGFLLTGLWAPLLIVGLSMGVSQGEGWAVGWSSPFVISSLLLSVAMGIGFVIYNLKSEHPIIELSIFRDRTFSFSIIALGALGFGFYGGNYLLPIYMEHALGYSAIFVGSLYLPVGIIQGVLSPLSGMIAKRTGEWILIVIGLSLVTIYLTMSVFYDANTSYHYIWFSVIIRGVGLGLAFTPLNALAVKHLENSQMASASGINNTIKQVSGSLGIAVFTAIVTMSSLSSGSSLDHHNNSQLSATSSDSFVGAIDINFAIAAFFSLISLIFIIMIKPPKNRSRSVLNSKV